MTNRRVRESVDEGDGAARPLSSNPTDWCKLIRTCLRTAGTKTGQDPRPAELLMRFATSARTLHEGFRRVFQPRGWTDHKISVLVLLSANAPQLHTPSELACQVGVTRASMTNVLLGLELRRWIERSRDSTDRRSVRVGITPEGLKVVVDAIVLYLDLAREIVSSMPSNKMEAFIRNCERLALAGERLGTDMAHPTQAAPLRNQSKPAGRL